MFGWFDWKFEDISLNPVAFINDMGSNFYHFF